MNPTVVKLSLDQKEKCLFELQQMYDRLFYGILLTDEQLSHAAYEIYLFFWCNGLGHLLDGISLTRTVTEKSEVYRLFDRRNNRFIFSREEYNSIANKLLVDIYKQRWGLTD